MTGTAIRTIAQTEDEQLAAVRLLLGVDMGGDVIAPLKSLLADVRNLRSGLAVQQTVNELTVRNLRKQILDIQVLLELA